MKSEQKSLLEITHRVAQIVDHCCKNSKETAVSIIRDTLNCSTEHAKQLVWDWEQGFINRQLPKKKTQKTKAIIERLKSFGVEVHKENKNISVPYDAPVDEGCKGDIEKLIEYGYTISKQPYIKQSNTIF